MHVALVSEFDPAEIRSWSGIPRSVADALGRAVDRVSLVGPLPSPPTVRQRVRQVEARVRGRRFLRAHTLEAAQRMGAEATRQLRALAPDAVLSVGSTPVGFIETGARLAMWSDATFESNLFYYDDYSGMSAETVAEGHAVEQAAQDRADVAVYASEHAARSAAGYYGAGRVEVVPFGANLPDPPSAEAVHASIAGRDLGRCQFVLLGMGWVRKGGDVAARAARELVGRGLEAELVVAGSDVPAADAGPPVRSLGFLDKRTPAGRRAFDELLGSSHFFVLPSRAEAFGCVFCEASAYGLPSIAPATGGIPTAVEDGVNGVLVPARPTPGEIATAAADLLAEPEAYRALCRSARARYERELNWDAGVRRVVELLAA